MELTSGTIAVLAILFAVFMWVWVAIEIKGAIVDWEHYKACSRKPEINKPRYLDEKIVGKYIKKISGNDTSTCSLEELEEIYKLKKEINSYSDAMLPYYPTIVFHGACHGCIRQDMLGIKECLECCNRTYKWKMESHYTQDMVELSLKK